MKNDHYSLYQWIYWGLIDKAHEEYGDDSPEVIPNDVDKLIWDAMEAWEKHLTKGETK